MKALSDQYAYLQLWRNQEAWKMIWSGEMSESWTELRYITSSELAEIRELQKLWGLIQWRKHASRELIKFYDLEEERQRMINPANCRND